MANKKTITATTTESYVEFPATYQFMWFMNYGENDCYISDHSGIVAGADDVILLKAGEARRLGLPQCPAISKAYIKATSGSNSVEVHAQNFSDCPFKKKAKGGEQITVESLTATENKTYTAPAGTAYSPVTVNVPNSYSAGDEGKVVSNGALVSQTSDTKTQNGTYNTTLNNEIVVNVTPPVELISRADWNALTTAQKKAKGLVAIQDTTTGYRRGDFVNGADYPNLYVEASGYGHNSTSVTVPVGEYCLYVIALNSEASTQDLTISVTKSGTAISGTTVDYNEYSSSGDNRRNYRINKYSITNNSNAAYTISLSDSGSYSAFVYALVTVEDNTFDKALTSADAITTGSNNSDGFVMYGIANGSDHIATINAELYEANTTITTADPGSGYKSSYIFWFEWDTQSWALK